MILTHVGNGLGEVRKKCQVVIMVSSDIESIFVISAVAGYIKLEKEKFELFDSINSKIIEMQFSRVDPVHNLLHTVVDIKHGTKQIIHMIGVGSPIDITLLVHEEETIFLIDDIQK
jgi:hypothetical protein